MLSKFRQYPRRSLTLLASLAAVTALAASMVTTGAWWSQANNDNAQVTFGTLSQKVNGSQTGGAALAFTNLEPGAEQADQFTTENNGSLAQKTYVGVVPSDAVPASVGQYVDVAIDGVMGWTALNVADDAPIYVGQLNSGQARQYTVRVRIKDNVPAAAEGLSTSVPFRVLAQQVAAPAPTGF